MYTSPSTYLLLLIWLLSYLKTEAQNTPNYSHNYIPYLVDTSISKEQCRDSIVKNILLDGKDMDYFFSTPMYFYREYKLKLSYTAFSRLLEVYPSAIQDTRYQIPIIESYSHVHDIASLEPAIWSVIAQNYDRQDFIQVPNRFYTALRTEQDYQKNLEEQETIEHILNANTSSDETKISIDYRQEKILVSRHERLEGESFYVSQKKKGEWQKYTKEPFLSIVNNTQTAASVDASGRYVLFTQCMARAWDAYAGGGCDLWFTTSVEDSLWTPAQKYHAGINTPAYEGLATFSLDGRVLYFTSDREGGYGKRDIWYSEWDGKQWKKPQNAGPLINSAHNDFSPFISEDGKILFFASDRERQSDIYYHISGSTESEKLPSPINTPKDEISCHLSTSLNKIIVASNAHSTDGDFDLIIHPLPDDFQIDSSKTISGQMLYLHTLKPYYAEYGRKLAFETQEDAFKISNRGNGWYFWNIVGNKPVESVQVRNLVNLDSKEIKIPIEQDFLSYRLIWNQLFN